MVVAMVVAMGLNSVVSMAAKMDETKVEMRDALMAATTADETVEMKAVS
jgi:hypothetical protein